jgi:tRNA threonylcarbamoyl adenosine modification protein YeaZ
VLVLVIDTSSAAVTAGIVEVSERGVVPCAEQTTLNARGHGEYLAPGICGCLADLGAVPADLGAVVVGTGPGPYTGLRVGLVTARVFSDAIGAPVYGVCSLDAIGDAGADEPALLVATDARRKEVYWARYEFGRPVTEPAVARAADISLDGLTAVAGAGGDLYPDAWPQLRRRPDRYPDPVALARCAADRVRAAAPSDPITPLYLRRPDAVVPGAPKAVTQ